MIIYYSTLRYRVTIKHSSDNKSKVRYVSTVEIRHMVYTDTG